MEEEVTVSEPKAKTMCVPGIPGDVYRGLRLKAAAEGKYVRQAVIEALTQYVGSEYQR